MPSAVALQTIFNVDIPIPVNSLLLCKGTCTTFTNHTRMLHKSIYAFIIYNISPHLSLAIYNYKPFFIYQDHLFHHLQATPTLPGLVRRDMHQAVALPVGADQVVDPTAVGHRGRKVQGTKVAAHIKGIVAELRLVLEEKNRWKKHVEKKKQTNKQ